ncbi:NmrA family protein-like protein [Boeremia exigua]|uniref:NmrA family protein-like protein n=1 Tax=Boeremia exigua TaxID=749465 RepID=UPI001E8E7935|nr:NmrA family protein-like protein [Boeremia exigua]KAH6625473.1 NmrA family protein-like protein [Boeremia exigua]
MPTTIAIAGIGSTLALLVAKSLLQRPDVYIRGTSRDITKLPDDLKSSSRVTLVQSGPYDTDTLRKVVHGSDAVVCCYFASNEVMIDGQKLLIDLCEEEGITRYIASDYTIDFRKLDPTDMDIKNFTLEVRDYLTTKSRVKGVHILNGFFIETFLDYIGLWNPQAKEVRYWGSGNEKWDFISYKTGADYVAAVTLDPNAFGFFKFRADHKSAMDIAEDVESVFGFRPALVCNGSLADLATQLDGAGNINNVISASIYFVLTGKLVLGEDLDNAKYPSVQPESFSEVLRRHSK